MNTKQTILVVDDIHTNISLLRSCLRGQYTVLVATNGKQALEITQNQRPDLILLDIMMPEMDGFEVCRRLKNNPLTANIPVIFLTALSEVKDEEKGFKIGAVDYITKPFVPVIVLKRVQTQLALANQNKVLEEKVRQRTKELSESRLDVIRHLAVAAEFRDNETGLHVVRMSHYARLLILSISGGNEELADLFFSTVPMHDIGKIGIPDNILLKPGKLSEEEMVVIKKHPGIGGKILGQHQGGILGMAKMVSLTHHEKWDGTGYPKGLKGEDIPIIGRVSAVADVFDALTTKRPYKEAWTTEKAVGLIKAERGKHFDPNYVSHFLTVLSQILEIREKFAE